MTKLSVCVVLLSISLPALAADPPAPHWFTWYGQRLPLVEADQTLVVELSPVNRLPASTLARDVRAVLVEELAPQGRRLVILDVSGLSPTGREAARQSLAKLPGFVAFLMPLASRGPALEVVVDRFVLVRFAPTQTRADVVALGDKLGFKIERSYAYAPLAFRLELTSVGAAIGLANELVRTKLALNAEPDRLLKPRLYYTPTDDWYPLQWHLSSTNGSDIGAATAWDTTLGSLSTIVAVADTGVELTHPELQGVGKIVAPIDVYDNDDDPTPGRASTIDGHGTSCAGLVLAGVNAGGGTTGGMVGVCPECALMPIRLGPGDGMWGLGSLITVFDHTWQNGAKVMSNSWGFGDLYIAQAVYDSLHNAVAHGVSIFFASGNDGAPMVPRDFSSDPTVIAVGGSSYNSQHVSYANTGPNLDIVAPTLEQGSATCPDGPGIHTTDMAGDAGFNPREDSGYSGWCAAACTVTADYTCFFSGTSAACPIAAGAAGLLVSYAPSLTPAQVRSVLTQSAAKVGSTVYRGGFNREMGWGRVDIAAAIALVAAGNQCQPVPEVGALCTDTVDNDCDALTDADDLDCGAVYPAPLDLSAWGVTCGPEGTGGECGNDLYCQQTGSGSGQCTMGCYDMCPTGFACVPFSTGGWGTYCMQVCESDASCPSGYFCAKDGPTDQQICTKPCTSSTACLEGIECSRAGGLCGMNNRVNDPGDGGPRDDGAPGDPAAGDPTVTPDDPPAKDDKGCGCNAPSGSSGALVAFGMLALVVRRRRAF